MPRGRYAPSPTGWLHLGNARTALAAWLRARSSASSFVLRVEDLDAPRTVPEAVEGNLDELRWLGLDWDEGPDVGGPRGPYRQAQRTTHYQQALARLDDAGRTFPCWLSRKDLRASASAPHGRAPVYGPRQRAANARLAARKRAEGKTPAIRARLDPGTLTFEDRLAGTVRADVETEVGDLVLRRADGAWAYQLAVVVDDGAMGIEEVVRGDDLLPATAGQVALYHALGLAPPAFLHLPLLLDEDGARLAKRRGDLTLRALRAAGVRPERVVGWLAHDLGLTPEPRERPADELVPAFSLSRLRREPGRLGARDLAWIRGEAGLDRRGAPR